jgi:sugar fermentation stimulation protein A
MIKFSKPLVKGTLLKRYKRFLADVELANGEVVVCHCPNTGSMLTCAAPGATVYLQQHDDPRRKLAYSWEYTATEGGYIGINTQQPNRLIERAIAAQKIIELTGYSSIRREVKYGHKSRIDLLLEHNDRPPCYVEVKNATLYLDGCLQFPDAVTLRGQRHLEELMEMVRLGHRAVMLFVANRPEGTWFQAAAAIDPVYRQLLEQASVAGVEVLCYRVASDLSGLHLGAAVPVSLAGSMP